MSLAWFLVSFWLVMGGLVERIYKFCFSKLYNYILLLVYCEVLHWWVGAAWLGLGLGLVWLSVDSRGSLVVATAYFLAN